MKHFQDDEDYDSMKDYEFSLMKHNNDSTRDNYDIPLFHNDDDNLNFNYNEPTIKHFQDD